MDRGTVNLSLTNKLYNEPELFTCNTNIRQLKKGKETKEYPVYYGLDHWRTGSGGWGGGHILQYS